MRTIYFEKDVAKVLLSSLLRPIWPGVVYSPLSPSRYAEVADEPLPGPNWVRVRNRLCGICATDLHLFFVETDPRIAAVALPGLQRLYLGHEVVGDVIEAGPGVRSLEVGDRVVMESRAAMSPTCRSQEVEPHCRQCQAGRYTLCENASLGQGPAGLGGGWGDSYTAHVSELYRVPDGSDDEAAMMIEPLAVGVHSALARLPEGDEQVLVLGCGNVGLNLIQALRALAPACQITAMARYPQQVEMAGRLGADEVITSEDPYEATARRTGGRLYAGPFDNRMILGGFDVVYDCVGSARTLQDSLRWARAGGTVVLVGVSMARLKVDLTPVWQQEVNLIGTAAHGAEEWNGRRLSSYDLTCELLLAGKLTVDGLITHRFPLEQWREAIATATDKKTGAIKVAFDYREGQGRR